MEVKNLLRKAAALAVEQGLSIDAFADAAWQAILDAKPGLREELETKMLVSQLDELRERGLVGSA